jgi:hypothetical protein
MHAAAMHAGFSIAIILWHRLVGPTSQLQALTNQVCSLDCNLDWLCGLQPRLAMRGFSFQVSSSIYMRKQRSNT